MRCFGASDVDVSCVVVGSLCMFLVFFFFNDTATTEIYTLSLHDALPILYFVPGLFFILFSLFCSFMVVWVFESWSFQLMGFGACGVGALFINIKE